MIQIVTYSDYREFLKDKVKEIQDSNSLNFSQIARSAGYRSPGYIQKVIRGDRNLSAFAAKTLALQLKLGTDEQGYFYHLVQLNQSRTLEEVCKNFLKLSQNSLHQKYYQLTTERFEFLSNWYYSAIWALFAIKDCPQTPEDIARILSPQITVANVKKALDFLKSNRLIQKGPTGKWRQMSNKILSDELMLNPLATYCHKKMIELGAHALESTPKNERLFKTTTIAVSESTMNDLNVKVSRLIEQILEQRNDAQDADRVVQVNFQLFALTATKKTSGF